MLKVTFIVIVYSVAFTSCLLWAIFAPSAIANSVVATVAIGGIVAIAATAFRFVWNPMLAAYPAIQPKPDAVRRHFQSFSLGHVNMGLSIHVAADDAYLHLTPLAIWRLLGAQAASVPWSALNRTGRSSAMLGKHRIVGPRWCIDLIGDDD